MKRIFLALGILLLWSSVVWANPFLVCDPQIDVDEYIVTFDGVPETILYNESGGVVILKDLVGIATGSHNVDVKAKNIWGESVSVPFGFVKSLPGAPTGIGLNP